MVTMKSVAAVAALSLVNTAQAWYNELPPCLEPFQPFVYTGCYDNGQPGTKEALDLRTDLDSQNMTVETCVAHCKGNGYRLGGLSYYGICYCGNTVSTALLDEDQCSFPCTGNSSQTCGGDTQINIWMDPTFPPLEEQTNVSEEYVSVGCWTDESSDGKALFYRQENLDSSTLTTETCLHSCLRGGFPFAGTEYGGECYCGVVVGNGTALATDSSTCSMSCNGDPSQICGGPGRLSLYVAKDLQSLEPCGYTPPESSSSSTPPTTSSTSSTPGYPETSSTPGYPGSSSTPGYPVETTTKTTTTGYPVYPTTTTTKKTTTKKTTTTTGYPTYPTTTTKKTTTTTGYPVSTTTKKTTTTTQKPTTTSGGPVCTTTSVTPPPCEYECGHWCSNPIPDWHDHKSCLVAWSQCVLQTADCFLRAGFPEALQCFEFGKWCGNVKEYCGKNCKYGNCPGKSDYNRSTPPKYPTPPVTHTTTIPCPTTVTTITKTPTTTTGGYPTYPTSSCAVPTPTGICTQPTNSKHGYGPGNPVGGIELPIVTCNNIQADWNKGFIFKLYISKDSKLSPAYTRNQVGSACADACKAQYQECQDVYVPGCKTDYFVESYPTAQDACDAQYTDCTKLAWNTVDTTHCTSWNESCGLTT